MSLVEPDAPKRKRLKKDDRARQLLDIAENLFITLGYEATTLEDVVRTAGVTRPVVYEHFGSKEGLFLACAKRAREDFEQQMTVKVVATQGSLGEVLAKAGDVFFRLLEDNPRRWALLFGGTLADTGELADGLIELRTGTIERIIALMSARLPAGVQASTVEGCAFAISGVGEQLGRWWLRHPKLPRATVVNHYKTFIVGGLEAMLQETKDGSS
jgi:AcrR family transcriptional regulator